MIERPIVGDAEAYRGRKVVVRLMGPDLLAYVDGVELSGFYLNRDAAIRACRRYVDDAERERAK